MGIVLIVLGALAVFGKLSSIIVVLVGAALIVYGILGLMRRMKAGNVASVIALVAGVLLLAGFLPVVAFLIDTVVFVVGVVLIVVGILQVAGKL